MARPMWHLRCGVRRNNPIYERQLRNYCEDRYLAAVEKFVFTASRGRGTKRREFAGHTDALTNFLLSGEFRDFPSIRVVQRGYKTPRRCEVRMSGPVLDIVTDHDDVVASVNTALDELESL